MVHKWAGQSSEPRIYGGFDTLKSASYTANSSIAIGQVAQLVERGPEKAGVGGSIPSLATILFNNLQTAIKTENQPDVHITYISQPTWAVLHAGSSRFHITLAVLLVLAKCCLASFAYRSVILIFEWPRIFASS